MKTPCQEWLESQIKGNRPATANALAIKWGVPSSYLARWGQGQVPEFYRIQELAEKSGTPLADLERIFLSSEKIKSAERRDAHLIQWPPTKPGAKADNSRLHRGEFRHAMVV